VFLNFQRKNLSRKQIAVFLLARSFMLTVETTGSFGYAEAKGLEYGAKRMRIIQITPGSGDNFYCENCLRDLSLVKAMHRAALDVLMVPLYLPLNLDAASLDQVQTPIFFGGINVYLQQKIPFFRKTPRWMDRWLDNPRLLKPVGKLAGMTSAKELGQTTVSMLQGPQGRQLKELDRLIDWLKTIDPRPDVIVLSNILLAGLAEKLKQSLNVPIVCLLQDEEGFLDSLPGPYAKEAWSLVRRHAAVFDALVAVSRYYRQIMADRLDVPSGSIHCIPMGLDPNDYPTPSAVPAVPTIGFLSRMSSEYGLDTLADAVIRLRRRPELKNVRLRVTGGKTGRDDAFIKPIQEALERQMPGDVHFQPNYDLAARQAFFQDLSLCVVPVRKPQAYGMFALEACASGVPFMVPKIGVFPEIAQATQAGILYESNTPKDLEQALADALKDPERLTKTGQKGRKGIEENYSIDKTVDKMAELFTQLTTI
jgi:glycosyltransferase involved in cell wall biosynthesis